MSTWRGTYVTSMITYMFLQLCSLLKSYWSPSQSSNETSMMLLFNQCICYFLCLEHSSPDSHIIHIFTLFWSLHFILVTIERPSMITLHKIILQLYSYQSLFFSQCLSLIAYYYIITFRILDYFCITDFWFTERQMPLLEVDVQVICWFFDLYLFCQNSSKKFKCPKQSDSANTQLRHGAL